jgi:prepilin-type N-terminal cleavage/methylation domain-containing protein
MMRRLQAEGGFTMIELLVAMALMAVIIVPVVDVFVSGARAGADANARLQAQQNTRLALDRIEYEGRCASNAALVDGGVGVVLTLPSWCGHTSGDSSVTWCVDSGVLSKYVADGCSGAGEQFVDGITTAAPFSLPTPATGDLPQLVVQLTVDTSSDQGTDASITDAITLRNAAAAS